MWKIELSDEALEKGLASIVQVDHEGEPTEPTPEPEPVAEYRVHMQVEIHQEGSIEGRLNLDQNKLETDEEGNPIPVHLPFKIGENSYETVEDIAAYLEEEYPAEGLNATPFVWSPQLDRFLREQDHTDPRRIEVVVEGISASADELRLIDIVVAIDEETGEEAVLSGANGTRVAGIVIEYDGKTFEDEYTKRHEDDPRPVVLEVHATDLLALYLSEKFDAPLQGTS